MYINTNKYIYIHIYVNTYTVYIRLPPPFVYVCMCWCTRAYNIFAKLLLYHIYFLFQNRIYNTICVCLRVYESHVHKLYIEQYIICGRFKYFANIHNNNFTDYNDAFKSYTYIYGVLVTAFCFYINLLSCDALINCYLTVKMCARYHNMMVFK